MRLKSVLDLVKTFVKTFVKLGDGLRVGAISPRMKKTSKKPTYPICDRLPTSVRCPPKKNCVTAGGRRALPHDAQRWKNHPGDGRSLSRPAARTKKQRSARRSARFPPIPAAERRPLPQPASGALREPTNVLSS